MKPHEIVQGYRLSENFGEIAKTAAALQKSGYSDYDILTIIQGKFGLVPKKVTLGTEKHFNVFGSHLIDQATVEQMRTCMRLPVATSGALMPDAHLGYAAPIGSVIALDNCVSPSLVGYDIACRVALSYLEVSKEYTDRHIDDIARTMKEVSAFGLGAEFADGKQREHPIMADSFWNELPILRQLKPLAQKQLGSSGGGNHFFDFGFLNDRFPCIMTHSGSRGTGHKLANYYMKLAKDYTDSIATNIPPGYEWLSLDTDQGKEYWTVMELMGRYAKANHELIHKHFALRSGFNIVETIENHHNFAWKEEVGIVHRKGATPADKNQRGIIPGSSGTKSYTVLGLGNPDSLNSTSHGAGRTMSRSKARITISDDVYDRYTQKQILISGLEKDETYLSYKDIYAVMEAQKELCVISGEFMPKIVLMGGTADDGD